MKWAAAQQGAAADVQQRVPIEVGILLASTAGARSASEALLAAAERPVRYAAGCKMLETLGNLGDFLGGVGVLISLLYLAIQVRENTISARSDSYQAVVTSVADWSREMSLNGEIARILNEGATDLDSLDSVERARFNYAMSSFFRNMENVHSKYLSGAIDEVVWSGWAMRIHGLLDPPGATKWWRLNESAFSPRFRSFVDEPFDYTNPPEILGSWTPPAA